VSDRKNQHMSCIQDFEVVEETRPLIAAEYLIKVQSKVEVETLLLMEEISWKTKISGSLATGR
jgi:hypothetical protein